MNAVGDSTSYQYDADGNQIEMISGFDSSSAATVRYVYDAAGNQIQEIDPDGNTTSYEYDADGNETLMIQAGGVSTSYQYDKDGNLISQSNPNGTSIQSNYNAQGEVTSEIWSAGSTPTNSIRYSYDSDGNLLSASNNAGAYSFAYNTDGEVTQSIDPNGVTLNYQYDAEGDATQITDSLGDSINSLYDANGNLIQRSATGPGGAQIIVALTYDGDGNPTSLERWGQVGGVMQLVGGATDTYDAQGNLTYIVQANAAGTTLDSFSYSYDPAGELKQEVDYNTGTTNYAYDATGQLTSAGATAYSYDPNGNPNQAGDSIGPNNELASDGTWNYSYDASGDNTGKVGVSGGPDAGLSWTYSYDVSNELIGATETNNQNQTLVQASYTDDVFGNLIASSVSLNGGSAVVTHYAYNGSTLWSNETASNAIQALEVSGDQPDQYYAQIDTNGAAWDLNDHLNTSHDVMNNAGQLMDSLNYNSNGEIVSQTNPSQAPPFGLVGYQTVAGLGFEKAGGRIYNPQTGRWEQEDSSGLGPDSNPYRYVHNDPTNATDPTGHDAKPANSLSDLGIDSKTQALFGRWWTGARQKEIEEFQRQLQGKPADREQAIAFIKQAIQRKAALQEAKEAKEATEGKAKVLAAQTAALLLLQQTGMNPQQYRYTDPSIRALTPEAVRATQRMEEERTQQIAQERATAFLQRSALQANPLYPADWDLLERVRQGYAAEDAKRMASMSMGERVMLFALEQLLWGLATAGVGEFAALSRAGRGVSGTEVAAFAQRNPQAVEKALVEGFEKQAGRALSTSERRQLTETLQKYMPEVEKRLSKPAPQSRLIGAGEGTASGRIPLNDVPVTRQPTANTCVPASVDMLLEELAPGRAATNIEGLNLRPGGVTGASMISFVADNLETVGMRAARGNLSQALAQGRPFIAIVDEGHAVVVQGIREVGGVKYLVVRDPLRGAYLEKVADFAARLVRDPKIVSHPTIWGEAP